MTTTQPLFAYFGHHKCASTWISDIVKAVCGELNLRFAVVQNARMFSHNLQRFVTANNIDFLLYTNAEFRHVQQLEQVRGFHVIRDPRDIVVSDYFSSLYSHRLDPVNWPELARIRRELAEMSPAEGLHYEIRGLRKWQFWRLMSWDYDYPGILQLKLEDITGDPCLGFLQIFRFLGLLAEERDLSGPDATAEGSHNVTASGLAAAPAPAATITADRLLDIVHDHRFEKKTGGRPKGTADVTSHYRNGKSGDWSNYFMPEHVRAFKREYPGLLEKLGYEQSSESWRARDLTDGSGPLQSSGSRAMAG